MSASSTASTTPATASAAVAAINALLAASATTQFRYSNDVIALIRELFERMLKADKSAIGYSVNGYLPQGFDALDAPINTAAVKDFNNLSSFFIREYNFMVAEFDRLEAFYDGTEKPSEHAGLKNLLDDVRNFYQWN